MEIKKVNWDDCGDDRGVIETHDPKKRHMMFLDPAQKNMTVRAKYKKCIVTLLITDELPDKKFNAKVISIESPGQTIKEPSDLSEKDIVSIDREHICWLIGE